MNNIFIYAPKELATDAFLAWCVKDIDSKHAFQEKVIPLFYKLGLCQSSKDLVSNIQVYRQEKNTDLIIRYLVNGIETQALFENKIYTTPHSGQLKRYVKTFPNYTYYKYMKLGYINYAEHKEARQNGYDVIDVYQLKSALRNVPNNLIVKQYREFLDSQFITPQNEIKNELISKNKYELFDSREAQQFILSSLHESIDGEIPNLYFKYGANQGGSHWTELDIAKRDKAYGNEAEYLFWRIDKRGKGYYIRLNQYSNIDGKFCSQKKINLVILRDYVTSLLAAKGLVLGGLSNSGVKESEVAIMFFVDNELSKITEHLPSLSKEIYEFYFSCEKWI